MLGEEVLGIWPRNADKADVNTAHVNCSGTAVATGDDYGCVKLFDQFPVSEKLVSKRKCTVQRDSYWATKEHKKREQLFSVSYLHNLLKMLVIWRHYFLRW